MIKYKNLTIIGTSHIAQESINEVEFSINSIKPTIIALELDKERLYALTNDIQRNPSILSITKIGFKGYLFSIFGAWIERKLGKLVGISPGSEMKKAAEMAKKNKIKIALVDQDIKITLKKLSKEITLKEKFTFFYDLISSPFKKTAKVNIDLNKVPSQDFIKKVLKQVKDRYPSFYKVLVSDRNKVMAKNLYSLIGKYPNEQILAVVGAGHEIDIINEIKKIKDV